MAACSIESCASSSCEAIALSQPAFAHMVTAKRGMIYTYLLVLAAAAAILATPSAADDVARLASFRWHLVNFYTNNFVNFSGTIDVPTFAPHLREIFVYVGFMGYSVSSTGGHCGASLRFNVHLLIPLHEIFDAAQHGLAGLPPCSLIALKPQGKANAWLQQPIVEWQGGHWMGTTYMYRDTSYYYGNEKKLNLVPGHALSFTMRKEDFK